MASMVRLLAAAALACGLFASPAAGGDPLVGLIVKTEANPFFVAMKEAALARARDLGVDLRVLAGGRDGDTDSQAEAIGTLVAAGARGILVTPSDPAALAPAVAQARAAGVPVIALDTPFDPADTADATFATDNFRAGEAIGRWARLRLGERASGASIAMLDGSGTQVTVEVLRNQGFLKGFGIDPGDPGKMYDEADARIVGYGATSGTEAGGRAVMERLLRETPGIDVVYAINEPAAAGALAALIASGRRKGVLIVAIDGGCAGIAMVADGGIDATAMQYPLRMAVRGLEAVVDYIRTGRKPGNPPGRDFHDTGVILVTDAPVRGVPSIATALALKECWR